MKVRRIYLNGSEVSIVLGEYFVFAVVINLDLNHSHYSLEKM